MKKNLQIILTILGIIFFVIAFILDITFFGQDKISWKYIEISRIIVIISIIAVAGLLLGLFLFRKQNYSSRILLTVPIAFILFSSADIIMIATNYYGLNEEYNYFSANRDIQNGKIQILKTGLLMPKPNIDWNKQEEVEKKVEKQFGYQSVYIGCIQTNGINIYNSVMEDHLEKLNGKNWHTKKTHIRDSLMKSNSLH